MISATKPPQEEKRKQETHSPAKWQERSKRNKSWKPDRRQGWEEAGSSDSSRQERSPKAAPPAPERLPPAQGAVKRESGTNEDGGVRTPTQPTPGRKPTRQKHMCGQQGQPAFHAQPSAASPLARGLCCRSGPSPAVVAPASGVLCSMADAVFLRLSNIYYSVYFPDCLNYFIKKIIKKKESGLC